MGRGPGRGGRRGGSRGGGGFKGKSSGRGGGGGGRGKGGGGRGRGRGRGGGGGGGGGGGRGRGGSRGGRGGGGGGRGRGGSRGGRGGSRGESRGGRGGSRGESRGGRGGSLGGRGGGGSRGKKNVFPKNVTQDDMRKRKQYEQYGEAHPIEERDLKVKRRKVEDTFMGSDDDFEEEESSDPGSSSDEEVDNGDPVSKLLATFNTNINKAIDSDEEEEDSEESDLEEAADDDNEEEEEEEEDEDVENEELEENGDVEDEEDIENEEVEENGEVEEGDEGEDEDEEEVENEEVESEDNEGEEEVENENGGVEDGEEEEDISDAEQNEEVGDDDVEANSEVEVDDDEEEEEQNADDETDGEENSELEAGDDEDEVEAADGSEEENEQENGEAEEDEEEDEDDEEERNDVAMAEEDFLSEDEDYKDVNDSQSGVQSEDTKLDEPYVKHFVHNMTESVASQLKDKDNWTSKFVTWPTLGRIKVELPVVEMTTPQLLLLSDKEEAKCELNVGAEPQPPKQQGYSLDNYHIWRYIQERVPKANINGDPSKRHTLTETQKEILAILSNYSDLYYPEATYDKWEEIRTAYMLHVANHVLKSRHRIRVNSAKMKHALRKKNYGDLDSYRDQGFCRGKVLIILPFKHAAYRVVETLLTLVLEGKKSMVTNHKRFRKEYAPTNEDFKEDKKGRPDDFQETFRGNTLEDFKFGLQLSKDTVKLYCPFRRSDIIIASPLAMRMILSGNKSAVTGTDFLSAIEMVILDQADIYMMQNWEHVLVLMEAINRKINDFSRLNTDLSRIRLWCLDGHAKTYRQTIVFGATPIDHNRAIFNKGKNFTGRLQVLNLVERGSVQEVLVPSELVLSRFQGTRSADSRFNYFVKELLPHFTSTQRYHTMIYIPDYCDYLRLVRYLKKEGGVSASTINEYMVEEVDKVAKARSMFFAGKRQFLIYTERYHFYTRPVIKGIRHIIFYDLPTYPHFFPELCNLMVEGNQNQRKKHFGPSTVTVMYQSSDLTKLVGVLGSQRAAEVARAEKPYHICSIGR